MHIRTAISKFIFTKIMGWKVINTFPESAQMCPGCGAAYQQLGFRDW